MKFHSKIAIELLSSVFLGSLLSSCGAPGPVNHVDFNTEFADTANVKTTPQSYGLLQEKEYRDLVKIDKSFSLSTEQIEGIPQNAITKDPEDSSSKTFSLSLTLDNEVTFDGADPLLNPSSQEIGIGEKIKKCSSLQLATDVKGINITYKVSKTFIIGHLYSFDDYKKECDQEVVRITSKLNSEGSFKFSYLHVVNPNDVATSQKGVAVITTPLGKTKLYRKLYRIPPHLLKVATNLLKKKWIRNVKSKKKKQLQRKEQPSHPKVRSLLT
ncbi:MAG: hypothetical protein R3A80_12130 [Bdellovibrionota bacterium]